MSGLAGRFMARDPIGYLDGDNLYRSYLGQSFSDPTGLAVFTRSITDCTIETNGPFYDGEECVVSRKKTCQRYVQEMRSGPPRIVGPWQRSGQPFTVSLFVSVDAQYCSSCSDEYSEANGPPPELNDSPEFGVPGPWLFDPWKNPALPTGPFV